MSEKELQQYLLLNYPKEDERCEWKEFKNLKNDFNGKEKDDVISYVSALANMEGGHLVIGVVDKTLEIVGTTPTITMWKRLACASKINVQICQRKDFM